eukprot:674836-Amphidinium_carterae.1
MGGFGIYLLGTSCTDEQVRPRLVMELKVLNAIEQAVPGHEASVGTSKYCRVCVYAPTEKLPEKHYAIMEIAAACDSIFAYFE